MALNMALNIRNDEAERLVAELARRTGESKTEAVIKAVLSRLDHDRHLDEGSEGVQALDPLLHRAGVDIVPVDLDQARQARRAFSRFGKGRDIAALNVGDCFSYALAVHLAEPLLFNGDDFIHTDVGIAARP
jgi:ribonuclease VapC